MQAGRVVAADLGGAGALRRGTVVVGNQELVRGHAAFEVRADRDGEDREDEFRRGAHTDVVAYADDERTQVQCTFAVWRNEAFVGLDHLFAGVDELFGRHLWHQQAVAAALHAQGVLVRAEQVDRAVLAAVGLHAFETLLAIMQRGRTFADVQHVVFGQGALVPLAVTEVGQVALVGLDVVEAQLVPVNAFVTHGTLESVCICLIAQASVIAHAATIIHPVRIGNAQS
ncbi:hypothetical protein D3C79_770080 [compost metagenome]